MRFGQPVTEGFVAFVLDGEFPKEITLEFSGYDNMASLYAEREPGEGYSVENNVRGVFGILDSAQVYGGDGSIDKPYHLK